MSKVISLEEWKRKKEEVGLTDGEKEYLLDRLLVEVVDTRKEVRDLKNSVNKLLRLLRKK